MKTTNWMNWKMGLALEGLFLGAYLLQGGLDLFYSTNDLIESLTVVAGLSLF
jgi:hypothetical protein